MLVVADELPSGVGGEGGLARTGETEEEGDIALLADVCGRVEGELPELNRLEVVLYAEDQRRGYEVRTGKGFLP